MLHTPDTTAQLVARNLCQADYLSQYKKRELIGSRLCVPPVRIELTPSASEAGALSAELRGRLRRSLPQP
jgi:hypothetical protein